MAPRSKKTFEQLERFWYERLREEGFQDIEDTSNVFRPLKAWHSHRFGGNSGKIDFAISKNVHGMEVSPACDIEPIHPKKRAMGEKIERTREFYDLAWSFLHTHKFKKRYYRKIWEMFCNGVTERDIALEVKLPKSTVHWIIAKLRREIQWK